MLAADAALARARAADEARARRESWGPFHGVPITIKDTFEVAGVSTTAGSAVAAQSRAVAGRRGRGASQGRGRDRPRQDQRRRSSPATGRDTTRCTARPITRGTSRARRAARPAAGPPRWPRASAISSRAAISAGSIRIPAHFCGIYGHKPSLDVVPMRGHIPPPPGIPAHATLDAAGGWPARALRRRSARRARGAGRARRATKARAWRWSLPPARARAARRLPDRLCARRSARAGLARSRLRAGRGGGGAAEGGRALEEGWPPGVNVEEQYDAYLTLLYARFTPPAREDQLARPAPARRQPGRLVSRPVRPRGHRLGRRICRPSRRAAAWRRGIWQAYFRTHDAFLMPTALVPAFPHDQSGNQLTAC